MTERDEALQKAIHVAGSQAKLAESIGLTQQAISKWMKVPAEYVVQVERATGVPRQELRPDLYEGMMTGADR